MMLSKVAAINTTGTTYRVSMMTMLPHRSPISEVISLLSRYQEKTKDMRTPAKGRP